MHGVWRRHVAHGPIFGHAYLMDVQLMHKLMNDPIEVLDFEWPKDSCLQKSSSSKRAKERRRRNHDDLRKEAIVIGIMKFIMAISNFQARMRGGSCRISRPSRQERQCTHSKLRACKPVVALS